MKINIERALNVDVKHLQLASDELYKSYDFTDENNRGQIIVDYDLIYDFYQKQLRTNEEIKKAKELIKFISPLDITTLNYNFVITQKEGNVIIEIGNYCAKIKKELEEYVNYLNELSKGFITKVEFEFEFDN